MNNIISLLRLHEGVEKFAYKCSAGKTTIGVGRNIDKDNGLGLSDDEIDYLLQNDIKRVIAELKDNVPDFEMLSSVRQSVLIDMCFNLGITRFLQFKNFLAAVNDKDWSEAGREMLDSRWANQVGQRAVTLMKMMVSDQWPG